MHFSLRIIYFCFQCFVYFGIGLRYGPTGWRLFYTVSRRLSVAGRVSRLTVGERLRVRRHDGERIQELAQVDRQVGQVHSLPDQRPLRVAVTQRTCSVHGRHVTYRQLSPRTSAEVVGATRANSGAASQRHSDLTADH